MPRSALHFHSVRRSALSALTVLILAALAAVVVPAGVAGSSASPRPNCGPRVAKPAGGFWQCTFDDEFNGHTLDGTAWTPVLTARTGVPTTECRVDSPNNISVSGGTLQLTVRKEAAPFVCSSPTGDYTTQYTGGAVSTYGKHAQAYGRFAIRAKFPATTVAGLHSAIWMWPQQLVYGDASGELDIAEFRTAMADRVVPFIHYLSDGTDPAVTSYRCLVADPGTFHDYVMEWSPDSIRFLYDGQLCLENDHWQPSAPLTMPEPFDQPFALILNQSLGTGGNAFDPSVTPLPATMEVDWVRMWS